MKNKKPRDLSILQNYKREINLNTKVVKDKKKYSRKLKHKNKSDFDSPKLLNNSLRVSIA